MSKKTSQIPADYGELLTKIKERVRAAQYSALRTVNKELVALYWDIGKMTSERQTAGAHGTEIVKRLASDLQAEFPGVAGFSWRNLFYMSEFFAAYRDLPKLQPLVAKVGWTQNIIVLQRCKDPLEREFYLRMTKNSVGRRVSWYTRSKTRVTKKPYWVRLISTARSRRNYALRPSWRSRTSTRSISSN